MKIMMMIGAAALAICGSLCAQPATTLSHVNVRFSTPVVVGTTTIPAGDCTIFVVRGSSDNVFLNFRASSGGGATVLVNRVNEFDSNEQFTDEHPRVILSQRGKDYRFERILMSDNTGFEVFPN